MKSMIPNELFFTKGSGSAENMLESFEHALREAGIEKFNLVKVSSIIPPNCKIISKEEGLQKLKPGKIVFLVLSRIESNEEGKEISANIGAAIPEKDYGYLSEYEAVGEDEVTSAANAERLAVSMLKTSKSEGATIGNVIAKSVSAHCKVAKGKWSCAVAAAVFV
ncbi:MAG: arginine decarboxylase, pyruvoyl-dependent [Candidatus Micrarchaeaceae archaeon]